MTLAVDKLAWQAADRPAVGHVAIIMDGNGRWAAERGLPRVEGHRQGVESVRRTVDAALELGITHLTLFSFSSENWARPGRRSTTCSASCAASSAAIWPICTRTV